MNWHESMMEGAHRVRTRLSRTELVLLLATGALVLIIGAGIHPLNSDEGTTLATAWAMFNGQELYRDVFDYIAPGSALLLTGVWQFTGADYFSARLAALVAVLVAVLLLWDAASKGGHHARQSRWSAVGYLALLASTPLPLINHNTLFILPAAAVVWMLARWHGAFDWRRDSLLGAAAGVSIWVLQHKGGALLIAVVLAALTQPGAVALVTRLRSSAIRLAAGLLTVATMMSPWRLEAQWNALWVFPATRYIEVQHVSLNVMHLLLGFILVTVWLLRLHGRWWSSALWPLIWVQVLLLGTALQRLDLYHLLVVIFPTLTMLGWPSRNQQGNTPSNRALSAILVAMLLASCLALTRVAGSLWTGQEPLSGLLTLLKRECSADQLLFAGPFAPGLYLETRRINVTRYSLLIERFNTATQFDDALNDLKRARPSCVILVPATGLAFGHQGQNVVERWIHANYGAPVRFGQLHVYRLMPMTP